MVDAGEDVPARVTAMGDDDSAPHPSELVGRSIAGKFVIEALIATGGAGAVYRARQLALDRTVALKVLRQDVARDLHFVERFKREARAASRLDHPNSVRVFDFGYVDDSLLYLAMELVEGRTLHHVIQDEWPLGDRRVVDIMSQVLSAIAVAHEMEVIHRDLKPDNIMIIPATTDDGEVSEVAKVCDFGIATLGAVHRDPAGSAAAGPWVTMDGSLVGTPGYMSPEQARGEHADRRSDIYSAGVVLYHLLAGRPPFDGDSAYFVAMKHITDAPVPPSTHAAVSPGLEAVCLRAMSKAPADRFDSAREMRSALRAALAAEMPAPAPFDATPPPRLAAPDTLELMRGAGLAASAGRRRAIATVAGLAAAAIVAGALAARVRRRDGGEHTPMVAAAATDAMPSHPAPAPAAGAAAAAPPSSSAAATPRAAVKAGAPVPLSPPTRPSRARPTRDRGLVRAAAVETSGSPTVPAPVVAAAHPPVLAASPPAAAQTAPPPPAPRIDIEHATASITAVTTTSAIPGSSIRAALGRVPLARCYRDALRAGGLTSGAATLRLRIDGGGYVTGAALQGPGITPALKGCIEKAATTMRIRDVDTGEATADVTLSFVAAP